MSWFYTGGHQVMEQRLGFTHTDRKQCVCVCVCVCHVSSRVIIEGKWGRACSCYLPGFSSMDPWRKQAFLEDDGFSMLISLTVLLSINVRKPGWIWEVECLNGLQIPGYLRMGTFYPTFRILETRAKVNKNENQFQLRTGLSSWASQMGICYLF